MLLCFTTSTQGLRSNTSLHEQYFKLHSYVARGPVPPKKTHVSCISGFWGHLDPYKTSPNCWGLQQGLGDFLAVPKLMGTSTGTWGPPDRPQYVLDRFQGRSEQISGMVLADFKDFLDRFQGCFGQISGIIQAYSFSFDNQGHWWLNNMIIFPVHYFCNAWI